MSTRTITDALMALDPQEPEYRTKRMELMVQYMKDYMNTYDLQVNYQNYTDRTFMEDVLYGLGVVLDPHNHQFANGFDVWKGKLQEFLAGDTCLFDSPKEPEPEPEEEVEYWVGDLCYVMHEAWDEVCDKLLLSEADDEVEYTLEDGRKFVLMNTMYGDGCYQDQFGHSYPVDAGVIGAIRVEDIRDKQAWLEGGEVLRFEGELNASNCFSRNGVIHINGLEINTGDEE